MSKTTCFLPLAWLSATASLAAIAPTAATAQSQAATSPPPVAQQATPPATSAAPSARPAQAAPAAAEPQGQTPADQTIAIPPIEVVAPLPKSATTAAKKKTTAEAAPKAQQPAAPKRVRQPEQPATAAAGATSAPGGLTPLETTPGASTAAIPPATASPAFAAPVTGPSVASTRNDTQGQRPVFRAGDLFTDVPGISVKQGNGPRDIGISIRGSNARNGFGIRNIVMFEDGFPVTQPDGLSRTDLTDPHAYAGVDVFRGPSSSLFGNYATGGAVNFRTRPGGEINGFEYGVDVGSFGYLNNYLSGGSRVGNAEFSIFASDVRGDGYMGNSDFNTQTVNALLSVQVTPQDQLTFKIIHNELFAHLPVRQSLAQFLTNPYDKGCEKGASLAPGCGSVSLFVNGYAGTRRTLSAAEAGLNRDDERTILAARWEHAFDPFTILRTQFVWDDRNINQPTGATSAIGDYTSWNMSSALTRRTELFGLQATHSAAIYYNFLPVTSGDTFNVMPGGDATLGRQTVHQEGITSNLGFRLREELKLNPDWTFAAGLGVEQTHVGGLNKAFAYNSAGNISSITTTRSERDFNNSAPEVSLTYQPDQSLQVRGRVSAGYGTPQFSNLFVTAAGVSGNNTNLEPQSNVGYDLGFTWAPIRALKLDVTGFYEFFENELVSQSPGAGLLSYTFNAPASEHRGVEVALTAKPMSGVTITAAYLYNDQIYTEYSERLSTTTRTALFDRAGNKIPGVAPNELTTRLGYDTPSGPLAGLGAFVEYQWRDAFFMDNANLLKAPEAETVNLNVHYKTAFASGPVREMLAYFEVHNVFDKANIASANNVSDTLTASGTQTPGSVLASSATGSIYAAEPRAFYGGVKLKF